MFFCKKEKLILQVNLAVKMTIFKIKNLNPVETIGLQVYSKSAVGKN